MTMITVHHDAQRWTEEIALVTSKGRLFDYIDVVPRDSNPDELLVVVFDYESDDDAYSNDRAYGTYQHAFAAIGAALDKCNPAHDPLSDHY